MLNRILQIIFFQLLACAVSAQILPAENDTLNFRLVGFSVPEHIKAGTYKFEIAEGRINNNYFFQKNIIITKSEAKNRVVIMVPDFRKEYTWRCTYMAGKKRVLEQTQLYHFTTGFHDYTDTSKYRLRVIDSLKTGKNLFVIFDYAPVMYSTDGKLVWYLPDIPGVTGPGRGLRDLKPTPSGSFTLMSDLGAFEVDYYGNVLWKAPDKGIVSKDTSEHYHHEFTKQENGHYFIAGTEQIERIVPATADTTHFASDVTVVRKAGVFYKKIDCPTLIEFDTAGNIVWTWKSAGLFDDKDFFNHVNPDGTYQANPHMNSFQLVPTDSTIYISLRNYNRIMKIKYPSGKVLAEYGTVADNDGSTASFRAAHCVRKADDGMIYVFNNNTDRFSTRDARFKNIVSSVQAYREVKDPPTLELTWESKCDIDTFALPCAQSGGSVELLSDGTLLVGMGIAGRSYIINKQKNILWNAIPERREEYNHQWITNVLYRAIRFDNIESYIFINK